MFRETLNALLACFITFALCAVAYPAAVYLLGQACFPRQASGSLVERDGRVVGSELIAQPFVSGRYSAPRPSAAGANGYAADAASGSNLGTTNPALRDRIATDSARLIALRTGDPALVAALGRLDALRAELKARAALKDKSPGDDAATAALETQAAASRAEASARAALLGETAGDAVPVDLVTASGSGLDPDLSPESALYQADRVAAARGLSPERVCRLVAERTDHSGSILGAPPRVNVLLLNLALDEMPSGSRAGSETAAPRRPGPH